MASAVPISVPKDCKARAQRVAAITREFQNREGHEFPSCRFRRKRMRDFLPLGFAVSNSRLIRPSRVPVPQRLNSLLKTRFWVEQGLWPCA